MLHNLDNRELRWVKWGRKCSYPLNGLWVNNGCRGSGIGIPRHHAAKSEETRKVEYAYNFWKCADAVYPKLSKSVHAWRNYSLPKLARFWDNLYVDNLTYNPRSQNLMFYAMATSFCLLICLFVRVACEICQSHSLRGSIWRRPGAYCINSDTALLTVRRCYTCLHVTSVCRSA